MPSTFKAYRYQQHRWSCGPANLFRKMFLEIVKTRSAEQEKKSTKLTSFHYCYFWLFNHHLFPPCYCRESFSKKMHLIYSFFFVRKIVAHTVTFVFYCVVIPSTALVPEVHIPRWGSVYIPSIITVLNAVGTPRYD